MPIKEKGAGLISTLERQGKEPSKLWAVSKSGMLLVAPLLAQNTFPYTFKNSGLSLLERPPEASELDKFSGVVVLEPNPGTGDPMTARALWESQSSPHALGAIFPSQRPHLKGFETLIGVLFPQEVKYQGPVSGELIDPWLSALGNKKTICLTRVLTQSEQEKSLDRILSPQKKPVKLAVFGLGDIGGFVAQTIYAQDTEVSNVSDLLISSRDANSVATMNIELQDIKIQGRKHPNVIPVTLDRLDDLFKADVILFLASGYIPPADSTSLKIDVRAIQYTANTQILRELAEHGKKIGWDGILIMASDPVEQMAMSSLKNMVLPGGNNQRIAGFGAAINHSRARNQAEEMGLPPDSVEVYNVHGKPMIAIPFVDQFSRRLAEKLSLRVGLRNYASRKHSRKPWRAPAELMAKALVDVANAQPTWASPFLPGPTASDLGAYYGTRTKIDINLGTMTPIATHPLLPGVADILERGQKWNAETSNNPGLLHTDAFAGESDPEIARHIAFHERKFQSWLATAHKNLETINQPYMALSNLAATITEDIQRAIVTENLTDEAQSKQTLREIIEITLRRQEGILSEKLSLFIEGVLGGEILAGVPYSDLSKVCKEVSSRLDVKTSAATMWQYMLERREPEADFIGIGDLNKQLPVAIGISSTGADRKVIDNLSQLDQYLSHEATLDTFPLETLKYPHVVIRSLGWKKLKEKLQNGEVLTPALAKKIATLSHFGDDLTLYQALIDPEENLLYISEMHESQRDVLDAISDQMSNYKGKDIDNAIMIGTTGAPIGQHHVNVLHSAMKVVRERYPDATTEGYIALDDYSRSKAKQLLDGTTPSVVLRRRIAVLQTVNDLEVHVVIPAIPIWFDTANVQLLEQMQREVVPKAKVWRFIGGDSLSLYPQSNTYQRIPHVIDMRGQDRSEMDKALNRLKFSEHVQVDSKNSGSSTLIRSELKESGGSPQINGLTRAFMDHYGIFKK
jgi:hypothetical protein